MMERHNEIPKTAQITIFQFQEIYLREVQRGVTDLILVLINSQGSATYNNSVQAIELFYEEHPEYRDVFRVHSFDGAGYTTMYSAPVVNAARMQADGFGMFPAFRRRVGRGHELLVNKRLTADRISRILTMIDFDPDGVEQFMVLDGWRMSTLLRWTVHSLEIFGWTED